MTGINVIGMPFGLHGLGMELRDKVRAMVGAGIDVCIVDRNYSSINRQVRDADIAALVTSRPRHPVNLICHNLPATGILARDEPELFEGRHNIGAPYWEFPQLPEAHREGLARLDEIWVSNAFLKECFAAHTDAPIVQMPLHMDAPDAERRKGRKSGPLTFGYVFDFASMAARKDPKALLLAFLEAFGHRPEADVALVLKFSAEAGSRLIRQRDVDDVRALAALDARIELIERPLSTEEMAALYDRLDVYVSPHRAEGLGRGVIEAMLSGRAVAATAYSGPAEFLDPGHAVPLAHYPTHVGDAAIGDIRSCYTWVDVCMESLIAALTDLADDPARAARLGVAARTALVQGHGASAHGRACADRLSVLAA